jgi:hypothetical protein
LWHFRQSGYKQKGDMTHSHFVLKVLFWKKGGNLVTFNTHFQLIQRQDSQYLGKKFCSVKADGEWRQFR